MFDLKEHSHTRINKLTGDRILVSPHRTKRPWQGKVESLPADNRPVYDPGCYLCPGNKRADGTVNPPYQDSFVFTNDFASLLPDTPAGDYNEGGLLLAESARGICRVISFSPDHSLTLPLLSATAIRRVVDLWAEETGSIAKDPAIRYVQIFENKGEIMGCSNPHPHGQIWAQNSLPQEVIKETKQQKEYFDSTGRSLLSDYLELELKLGERIVEENEFMVALVPFWAVWPYETLVLPRRQVQYLDQLTDDERNSFSVILKNLTSRYDNLFQVSFPYSSGIHQAPVNNGLQPEWHLHMHFYPPLLRSATVKKFMVGYEMMANPQRDITPEAAAERLRACSTLHYKNKES